jgi:predicted MFS family arabinose efflux permease
MESPTLPKFLLPLLGISVGVIAANLYYAQPLIALIAHALELTPKVAGLVTTLTQIGYGFGVLFFVPLADLLENKKLILSMMILAIVGLIGLTFASSMIPYFIAAFILGLGTSAVQIIMPYVAHLTPEASRGKTVGTLLSGLMMGIMLARPVASLLTDAFNWHAVFILSTCLMTLLLFILASHLPKRVPAATGIKYPALIASMWHLFWDTEILRRRAIYQGLLFGTFCIFWTAAPLLLSGPVFGFTQTGIAIFALAGIAGAVAAPLAGKYADKGLVARATTVAMISCSLSFAITHLFAPGSTLSLVTLVLAGITLDAGVSANLVLGQRSIFSLNPEHRSRLNGLYIATIFVGGAFGSSVGAWAYAQGGWTLTSYVGFAMPMCALLSFATERFKRARG